MEEALHRRIGKIEIGVEVDRRKSPSLEELILGGMHHSETLGSIGFLLLVIDENIVGLSPR